MKPSVSSQGLQFQQGPEGPLLGFKALSEQLLQIGYPEQSVQSLLRCGVKTGQKYFCECLGCGVEPVDVLHKCNLRTCFKCSIRRKEKIRHKFLPSLTRLAETNRNGLYKLYFLTISPKNYDDIDEGLKLCMDGFKKFRRSNSRKEVKKRSKKHLDSNYIFERIKGGLGVLETTYSIVGQPFCDKFGQIIGYHKETGWHVHIHAIIYSRRLDNQIRGVCLDCNYNLLKFDKQNNKYHCSSKKCNSQNVIVKKDSKITQLAKKAFGRDCNVHVTDRYFDKFTQTFKYTSRNPKFCMNYMLKYVSANDETFSNDLLAKVKYIKATYNKNLYFVFGKFINRKKKDKWGNKYDDGLLYVENEKKTVYCRKCGNIKTFFYDIDANNNIKNLPPHIEDVFNFKIAT